MQPGQFLTDYLDALPKALKNYSAADKTAAERVARVARSQGVVFVTEGLPDNKDFTLGEVLKDVPLTPPYSVTVLEYFLPPVKTTHPIMGDDRQPRPRILVATSHREGAMVIPIEYYHELGVGWVPPYVMFMLTGDSEGQVMMAPVLPDSYNSAKKLVSDDGKEITEVITNVMAADIAAYAQFCRILHEREVTFDDVEPDKSKNRMRRARGKAPLFTYKVLTIGGPNKRKGHQGGTHASPRSHLRRGYYRTSKHGKRHWVQPCMVKGETPGFVHKDYKVEGVAHGADA